MSHLSKAGFTSLAMLLLCLCSAAAARAGTINFDVDASNNPINAPGLFASTTSLTTLYLPLGVTFSGSAPNNGGAILNQGGNFGVNARSGVNFLAFNRSATMANGGIPTDPETVTFSSLQSSVSIFASGGVNASSFLLSAFDENNVFLGSNLITTGVGLYGMLSFSSIVGIKSFTLTSSSNTFVFDDLSFTPATPGAVPEPTTMLLLGTGLAGIAAKVRRRRGAK